MQIHPAKNHPKIKNLKFKNSIFSLLRRKSKIWPIIKSYAFIPRTLIQSNKNQPPNL